MRFDPSQTNLTLLAIPLARMNFSSKCSTALDQNMMPLALSFVLVKTTSLMRSFLKNSAYANCLFFTHPSLRCHLLLVLLLPSLISFRHNLIKNTRATIVPINLVVTGQAIKTTPIRAETTISEIPIIIIGTFKTEAI